MEKATEALLTKVAEARAARASRNRPVNRQQVRQIMADIVAKMRSESTLARDGFSISKMIRGLSAMRHQPIVADSAEDDANYAKAISTGTVPGQYLIPTVAANKIVSQLSWAAPHRAAGATVWPMVDIKKMTIPLALTSPSFVFVAQNSRQSPTDLNAGQMTFDLAEHTSLQLIPIQLFKTMTPGLDALVEDFLGIGMAESEAACMFASSSLAAPAPPCLLSQSGIQTLNAANGSGNGGNLLWGDLIAALEKMGTSKAPPPYCWFMSPRSLTRLLTMQDTSSRPLLTPMPPTDLPSQASFSLLGWPIFLTDAISNVEAVGSGSGQSHILLCRPSAIHVGENSAVSLAVSSDFALDSGDIAIRVGHGVAFNYQPAASIVAVLGVN